MKVEGRQEPSLLLHLRPSIGLTVTSKPVMATVLVFPGKHDPLAEHKHDSTCNFCAKTPQPDSQIPTFCKVFKIQFKSRRRNKTKSLEAGEMFRQLRALTACPKDLGQTPSPHLVAPNLLRFQF